MTRFEAGGLVQKITQRIQQVRDQLEFDYSLDPLATARQLTNELTDMVLQHVSLSEQRRDRENAE